MRRILSVVFAGICLLAIQVSLAAPARAGTRPPARNVILVIGDGMGLSQLTSGLVAAGGALAVEGFPVVGLSKTFSSDKLVTDSAAAATALACGVKTRNGAIGVERARRTRPVPRRAGAAQGDEDGNRRHVEHHPRDPGGLLRAPGLPQERGGDRRRPPGLGPGPLHRRGAAVPRQAVRRVSISWPGSRPAGYELVTDPRGLAAAKGPRLAGLVADEDLPTITDGRGAYLPDAVRLALARLPGPKGFFLMVEGSQVDYGAHDQDAPRTAAEVVDLDRVIARALDFARRDRRTLVVVTADHETGGFALTTARSRRAPSRRNSERRTTPPRWSRSSPSAPAPGPSPGSTRTPGSSTGSGPLSA